MTRLDAGGLFAPTLPEGAAPAVALLGRLEALVRAQKEHGPDPARRLEAQDVYSELLTKLGPLCQDDVAPSLGPSDELRVRFVESVLLWLRFCESSSSVPLVDSLDTRSIRAFPLDLPPDALAFTRLRSALALSQGVPPAELADAERRVEFLCSALAFKKSITSALAERLQPGARAPAREKYLQLLRQCYGELPWRASDVDLVLTSTAIFFVLPIAGEKLDVSDWQARPEPERAAIAAFLARLARENLTETWRFPSFGLFDAAQLDDGFVQELAALLAVSAPVLRKTLATMVSILSKAEIDQYLVHDAWGHTWQEVLNEFEFEYELLRRVSDPLSPADGPTFGGPVTAPLAQAFRVEAAGVVLDEASLLASAEADLRGRIQVGLSQVLSEVLADFVEAKFSRLNPDRPLPTSSLLHSENLKLDLTLQDVLRQARRWSRPYRELWSKPEARARWVAELARRGLPEAGLAGAVDQAARLLERTYAQVLRPQLATVERGQSAPPGSTVATRTLLELSLLCAELERLLGETAALRATPAWKRPTYCPDLWAVSLSHLYEADRQQRFWCLDTLVRKVLRGACEALGRELERAERMPAPRGYGSLPGMANPGVLSPLFTNIPISADDAVIMAAALRDIAAVDGTHPEEQALIQALAQGLADDLGDTPVLPQIGPKELSHKLIDPQLRTVFLQAALVLAMADGKISAPERLRILEYARALGVSDAAYAELERVIESWVKSGDMQSLFT